MERYSSDPSASRYVGEHSQQADGHVVASRRSIVESPLESLVACHECDLLHDKVEIEVGAVARCVRCNATLYENKQNSIDRALAIGVAALIMFVIANCFPFLKISVSGNSQSMSIVSAVVALSREDLWVLALLCFGFILFFPLIRMAGLLYILLPLRFNKLLPGKELVFRSIVYLSPWSMMEIYFFGAIVALVKLASMANIELGYSFWAFALLNLLTAASLQLIDNHSLWEYINQARRRAQKTAEVEAARRAAGRHDPGVIV